MHDDRLPHASPGYKTAGAKHATIEAPERLGRKTGKQTKTWTGYWYDYVRQEDGSEKRLQRSKVLGSCAEMGKGTAEDKLHEILRDERPPQTNATFEQLATWYLKTNQGRWSKKWNDTSRGIFTYQILPRLGSRIPSELKKSDVQQAINDIAADPKSQSASIVKKSLTHIRAVFNQAIEDEFLERNPARKLDMPRVRRPNERFLTLEECQRLLAAAGARDRVIIRLRPSELFALRVNDVLSGELRIDETVVLCKVTDHTKTEGSRGNVPLAPALEAELYSYMEAEGLAQDDFLFPSAAGTAISPDNYLDRVLQPLGELAKIEGLTHQMLRRTTGTHFQKHGRVKDTQALLRHSNASTTLKHYQKTLESLIAGVENWDAELRKPALRKVPGTAETGAHKKRAG